MQTEIILNNAERKCIISGARLTKKRRNILSVLLNSDMPLSAYEVMDVLAKHSGKAVAAMSVYRILDFLVEQDLVHKLSSENKYLACSHISCAHAHEVPQFLICKRCKRVKEIAVSKSIVAALTKSVMQAGFQMNHSQLELECICHDCLAFD